MGQLLLVVYIDKTLTNKKRKKKSWSDIIYVYIYINMLSV